MGAKGPAGMAAPSPDKAVPQPPVLGADKVGLAGPDSGRPHVGWLAAPARALTVP